jgi:hypothetical protein
MGLLIEQAKCLSYQVTISEQGCSFGSMLATGRIICIILNARAARSPDRRLPLRPGRIVSSGSKGEQTAESQNNINKSGQSGF